MKSRRFLPAVIAASVMTAVAAPAVWAADSSDHISGRMAEHMADQRADRVAGEMTDITKQRMSEMPGNVTMPPPGYEQTAKTFTPAELCKRYERRFDTAVNANQQAEFIDEARTLRIEGGNLCRNADQARGVHKLREALSLIGADEGLE